MKRKIMKKTLVISILSIFLLTSLQAVSSTEMKKATTDDDSSFYSPFWPGLFTIDISNSKIENNEVRFKCVQLTHARNIFTWEKIEGFGLWTFKIRGPCDHVYVQDGYGDPEWETYDEDVDITVFLMQGTVRQITHNTVMNILNVMGTISLRIERL
jgi:hypothetical protein